MAISFTKFLNCSYPSFSDLDTFQKLALESQQQTIAFVFSYTCSDTVVNSIPFRNFNPFTAMLLFENDQ